MKKQLLKKKKDEKKKSSRADMVDKVVANSLGPWTVLSWIIGTIIFQCPFPNRTMVPLTAQLDFNSNIVILKLKKPLAGWGSAALL